MPNTPSRIAICHGWPSLSSMVLSATAPIAAAGTVAITISHAMRSSSVSARRVWSVRTKPWP